MGKMHNGVMYTISFLKTIKWRVAVNNKSMPLQSIIGRNFRIFGDGKLKICKGFVARDNCRLESGGSLSIGEGCFLNNGVSITALSSIVIGHGVTIGNNTVIVDHNHNYSHNGEDLFLKKDVKIGNGVWIGANVVVLPGSVIGDNSVIGAGTVVHGIIPNNSVAYDKRELSIRGKQ